jgi:lysophospholipase L1-like esterase
VAVELTPWGSHARGSSRIGETRALNSGLEISPSVEVVVKTGSLGDDSGRLLPEYDSGDGLHLNAAGQRALGALIFDQAFGG